MWAAWIAVISVLIWLIIETSGRGESPTQIESEENLRVYRAILPDLSDPYANRMLHSPRMIWYTADSMGVAYQAHSGPEPGAGEIGFADAMATDALPNQNTVTRFPWAPMPGGTHLAHGAASYKGFYLPVDHDGVILPVVWYRHQIESLHHPNKSVRGWNWTFPAGSIVWEVLVIQGPDGISYPYEVRSRWRYADHWQPRLYRPFPRAVEAAEYVDRGPSSEMARRFSAHCRAPITEVGQIESVEPGSESFETGAGESFRRSFGLDRLPPLPEGVVISMLGREFVEVAGTQWKPGCDSPTTDSDFHIVPRGSLLAIVGSDEESCARCHDTSLTSSRRFGNKRTWGWVRGNLGTEASNGGIISWSPISPDTFRGRREANPAVRMRQNWVRGGIVAQYDPDKHPKRYYTRLAPEKLTRIKPEE
tara:strand:- start:8872 stop:10134 length:1263 start_codon:yes stop_codon:yes gene_type:complete